MTGSVVQVSISPGGMPKLPIPEGVVNRLGIEGDGHAHPQFHGGPMQALLLICAEAVEELVAEGFPLFFGALGENLTVRSIDRRQMRIGQRYRVGSLLIELTKVRVPCSALSVYGPGIQQRIYDKVVKANNPESERWGMSGFYAMVHQPGTVRVGDPITFLDQSV